MRSAPAGLHLFEDCGETRPTGSTQRPRMRNAERAFAHHWQARVLVGLFSLPWPERYVAGPCYAPCYAA